MIMQTILVGKKHLAFCFIHVYCCFQIYLNRQPNARKKLLVPCALEKPSPKCYVCAPKPEVTVVLNTQKMTVKTLEDKVKFNH